MSSRNWTRIAVYSCVVLAAVLLAAPARAQGNCTALAGTIAGHFDFAGPQGPSWYGRAYLMFGSDPAVIVADLVDLNNGYKDHPSNIKPGGIGNFAGYEILTFTVEGAGSFQLDAHFLCTEGRGPYTCEFSEEGQVGAGTGSYAGMRGNISIHGIAVAGVMPIELNPWLWVAQLSGSVCK